VVLSTQRAKRNAVPAVAVVVVVLILGFMG